MVITDIITPRRADSAAVTDMAAALHRAYPFLDMLPIGRSVCGRDIPGLMLGNGARHILFAAAFHGQEWITSLAALRLCEDMCRAVAGDGRLCGMNFRGALSDRSIVFVPLVNPDGVDIALHGSASAGEYAPLVAALGGDRPGVWSANARGVDLNHNFDAGFEKMQAIEREHGIVGPAPRRFGGRAAHSEPETRALVSLCERADFHHVLALHSQGEEIFWDYGDRTPPQAHMVAGIFAAFSGYTVAAPDAIASHAGFKDWFIEQTGRAGFTFELGRGENPLPLSDFEPLYQKAREMLVLAAIM